MPKSAGVVVRHAYIAHIAMKEEYEKAKEHPGAKPELESVILLCDSRGGVGLEKALNDLRAQYGDNKVDAIVVLEMQYVGLAYGSTDDHQ